MKLILFLMCFAPFITAITVTENSTITTTISPSHAIQNNEKKETDNVTPVIPKERLEDLEKAESKDPQKLGIIKQIRKINPDGSYTIGYEAEDGTFKIESRDVLGNVKGTYGYVDENGEIKRVSYTANNATGLKTAPTDTQTDETAQLPKYNRTYTVSSTRRPFVSSTTLKPSNIQSIPRKRFHFNERHSGGNKVGQEINSLNVEPTTTLVYATAMSSTSKPVLLARPTQIPYGVRQTGGDQLIRPEKLEIDHVSKVSTISSSSNNNNKDNDPKSGNHLRRQLNSENTENFETQQQIIYGQAAGDDNTHIFGSGVSGGGVTVRPLFTSTSSPRVPSHVLAARQRAAQLQNVINKSPSTTTERVYIKPPKRIEDKRYEQATEPQTSGPVVEIPPPGRDLQELAADDDRRSFRERPANYRPREFIRYVPTTVIPLQDQRQHNYRSPSPPLPYRAEEQFLRETTRAPPRGRPGPDFPEHDDAPDYRASTRPVTPASAYSPDYQQQSYPVPYPYTPNQQPYNRGASNSYNYDYQDRPLTTRDFERLLQLLIYRHQQVQQYGRLGGYPGVNPYYPSASPYPPINPYYGYQIPRPPFYQQQNPLYDPRYENPNYSPSTPTRQYPNNPQNSEPAQENEQSLNHLNQPFYESQRVVPRRRQYLPRQYQTSASLYNEAEYGPNTNQLGPGPASQIPDYLPPNVREDLLYRMFLLALRSENPERGGQLAQNSNNVASTTNIEPTTIAPVTSRKPVRSVQILGEESP